MKLIIAEKPSQAKDIAAVVGAAKNHNGYKEGCGYLVSWCVGHLVRLAEPEYYDPTFRDWTIEALPIAPDPMQYLVNEKKAKQFHTLKMLMARDDVESLICATDAGREGEHIFRMVYQAANCQKSWQRLWISSLTRASIRNGMEHLRDGHDYDCLASAALCRDQADWVTGINFSRLYSAQYDTLLPVGRVQTPTLALIVQRQQEIDRFRPEPYFVAHFWTNEGVPFSKRYPKDKKAELDALFARKPSHAQVISVKRKQRSDPSPALFNLTAIQQEANRLYGYSASETLATLQALYEDHLCGYPRTKSRFITADMLETVRNLVLHLSHEGLLEHFEKPPSYHRLIKEEDVYEHPGLLPTTEITAERLNSLNTPAQQIMLLLIYRLAEAISPARICSVTEVSVLADTEEFQLKAEEEIDPGWQRWKHRLEQRLCVEASRKPPTPKLTFCKGDTITVTNWQQEVKQTSPPQAYTEAALLSVMEHAGRTLDDFALKEAIREKGLGTASTRGAIIDDLVKHGYIIRKGKNLLPTEKGIALIRIMQPELCNPVMTAEWELRLSAIERGEENPRQFMTDLRKFISDTVRKVSSETPKEKPACFQRKSESKYVGPCPRCGNRIVEISKGFICTNRSCTFAIWKNNPWFVKKKKRVT